MSKDISYLKLAIKKSKESFKKGFFPAGAVVVKDGKVLSSEISASYPSHRHADSKAVDHAFDKLGSLLKGASLYTSMEPCMMCIARAYWAGIRRIVFACSKESVSPNYYESNIDNKIIVKDFHEKIDLIHIKELQDEVLKIVQDWERRVGIV